MSKPRRIIALFCCFVGLLCNAQNTHQENLKSLDQLISDEKYEEALTALNTYTKALEATKSYYDLTDYIYYVGKIHLELYGQNKATQQAITFAKNTASKTDAIKVKRQAQLELGSYYELIGDSKKAYDCNLEALQLTHKMPEATAEDFGLVENNLGTLSNRKGDISSGAAHHQKALNYYKTDQKTNSKNIYIVYNSLGGSMWYMSKIDSALYYYKEAEKTLKLLEREPMNLYYRPATLQNNMAGIYGSQGNLEMALSAMKQCINNLNLFIKSDVPDSKKESAREFLFMAIENYGGIYKDMGDFEKAKELLEYAHKEKIKHFDAESPEIFKSKILLGQIHLALKNYNVATTYLDDGLARISRTDGGNAFWSADAHNYKASVAQELGENTKAKFHYEQAENFYETALEGAYDELYLDFITNASHFYAKNGNKAKALAMAEKAYQYIKDNQGATTSFEIQQALNVGEIYFVLGDYLSALEKGKTANQLLKKTLPTQTNPSDSTKNIFYKPQSILLQSQATYKLQKTKDVTFLKKEFSKIKEAIGALEQQKSLVGNENNVSILINDNVQLFEYAKKLALELHQKTKEESYLNELVGLHESILYNRIRARLNSRTSMTYANLPKKVLEQEKAIQNRLKNALNTSEDMTAFFKANTDWTNYLEMLKKEHPKYYKLRFASISQSLENIAQKLPNNMTAVRYMYIDKELFAAVISRQSMRLFKLQQTNLSVNISKLQDDKTLFDNHYKALHELYVNLWKPFENAIKTDRIVIIPDRELFNLNFEMLTAEKVSSYKQLASQSLLSKHVISYNYSLFLIGEGNKTVGYKNNFVAFVPEFNDRMKSDYQIAVTDSLDFDKSYLTLLSQPFTKTLAKNSTRLFKGKSFLNEKSTEHVFKNSAKEHKIIHIGTHAESNNVSPELSRLVFAKSLDSNSEDDDYLYTYEIYNSNLASNLAILTACETGKPTYQAGEGMISLAHAFNYAGSESILTSLWKIDEQSSAKIIDLFYKYIKKGWSKDKALQKAKLEYIASAEGRTVHPQYWAGLVLIGDTSPIDVETNSSLLYWLIALALLLPVLYLFSRSRASKE
jgi:CHAT domain-containing protein